MTFGLIAVDRANGQTRHPKPSLAFPGQLRRRLISPSCSFVTSKEIPIKKQAMNPFLPLWEYTPDGEPHIFGDRIYLFGSHDTEGGDRYCSKGDYVGWSAPLDDLSDWRYEGVMYSAEQDPHTRPGCY